MGQRYLTHESDDERWTQHQRDNRLPRWEVYGQAGVSRDDVFCFNRLRQPPTTPR